jgi:hypothetical protein
MVIVPSKNKRLFWAKEMKFLNDLFKQYPDQEFWLKIKMPKKYESLLALKGNYGKNILQKKYSEFNYKIPIVPKIILGEPCGENFSYKKRAKTLKDFLKDE